MYYLIMSIINFYETPMEQRPAVGVIKDVLSLNEL
jgi:hypothetical protein